jgi:Tol biopolymer transport system component
MRMPSIALAVALAAASVAAAQDKDKRPMTFLDMRLMKDIGAPAPSPDGRWMLYTVSAPEWKEGKTQQDIYLVSLQQGLPSTKQMTFTREKNETSPRWAKDGRFFLFLSNRDAPESAATRNQLYLMRPDGGEARGSPTRKRPSSISPSARTARRSRIGAARAERSSCTGSPSTRSRRRRPSS